MMLDPSNPLTLLQKKVNNNDDDTSSIMSGFSGWDWIDQVRDIPICKTKEINFLFVKSLYGSWSGRVDQYTRADPG